MSCVKIDCHTAARSRAAGSEPPKMLAEDVVEGAPDLEAQAKRCAVSTGRGSRRADVEKAAASRAKRA